MLSAKALIYTFTMGALVLTVGTVAFGNSTGPAHRHALPAAYTGKSAPAFASIGPARAPYGRLARRDQPGRLGRASHCVSTPGRATAEAPA